MEKILAQQLAMNNAASLLKPITQTHSVIVLCSSQNHGSPGSPTTSIRNGGGLEDFVGRETHNIRQNKCSQQGRGCSAHIGQHARHPHLQQRWGTATWPKPAVANRGKLATTGTQRRRRTYGPHLTLMTTTTRRQLRSCTPGATKHPPI